MQSLFSVYGYYELVLNFLLFITLFATINISVKATYTCGNYNVWLGQS